MGARKKKSRKTKNRAYFMRFNPKMRRRRMAKTDYMARSSLVYQDKDKYCAPKYRMVVRITNRQVIAQVVTSKIVGDEIVAVAYSTELRRYGIKLGLTNYAACYATGLLLARRVLKKLGLDEMYTGTDEANGKYFLEEREDEPKNPFSCILDVGLRPTTTGARVYAAMKGAVDGGLAIPHGQSGKQFPGWRMTEGQQKFDSRVLRSYIFGGHVAAYMAKLKDENEETYDKQFKKYIKEGISSEDLEGLYTTCHEKIRADPSPVPHKVSDKAQVSKYTKTPKQTLLQRKDHVLNKILSLQRK